MHAATTVVAGVVICGDGRRRRICSEAPSLRWERRGRVEGAGDSKDEGASLFRTWSDGSLDGVVASVWVLYCSGHGCRHAWRSGSCRCSDDGGDHGRVGAPRHNDIHLWHAHGRERKCRCRQRDPDKLGRNGATHKDINMVDEDKNILLSRIKGQLVQYLLLNGMFMVFMCVHINSILYVNLLAVCGKAL